uniref:ATP-grasp domain-containing protein n=1 Tax=Syphacia muris TaxID=451379 RepID=A0A0N5AF13_9BILA
MESITSGMNFLKRRFSSQDSCDDKIAPVSTNTATANASGQQTNSNQSTGFPLTSGFSFSNIANKVSSTISAPSSPSKSVSVYSQVQGITKNLMHAASGGISYSQSHRGNYKTVLIIDDEPVDWNKYFRINRIGHQLRIEQAPFWNIHVCCYGYKECTVEIRTEKERRVFHPDFVFYHQLAKSDRGDFSNIVFALVKAGIPSINSPDSVLTFINKNWMESITKFPVVIRVGHGNKGSAKIKIDNELQLLELEGIVRSFKASEVTTEPFIETKYDLHLQKIGNEMKSFIRKGISNNWKSSASSAVLEQIAITNRHKQLIQLISDIFGGMDIVGIDILVAKDGREIVHDVNDVLNLLGDTQEEDRRAIADLIQAKILHIMTQQQHQQPQQQLNQNNVQSRRRTEQPPLPPRPPSVGMTPSNSMERGYSAQIQKNVLTDDKADIQKRSAVESSKDQQHPKPMRQRSITDKEISSQNSSFQDDTMGQLKRTFAGIFGDV